MTEDQVNKILNILERIVTGSADNLVPAPAEATAIDQTEDGYILPVKLQCCGSHSPKHRKTCTSEVAQKQRMESSATARKGLAKGSKKFACSDCGHTFFANPQTFMDSVCPKCKSIHVNFSVKSDTE